MAGVRPFHGRFAGLSQRKRPAAIGVKAAFPGFIEPALRLPSRRCPPATADSTKSNSTATGCRSISRTRRSRSSPGAATTGPSASRKSPPTPGRSSAGSAIIDGEFVVPAADGTTDFSVLQNELKGKSTKIVLVAFDLLYLNG